MGFPPEELILNTGPDMDSFLTGSTKINANFDTLKEMMDALTGEYQYLVEPTATPTPDKVPISDGSGKLDGWITTPILATEKAAASGVASLDPSSKVVQEPASKSQASGIASLNSSSLVVQNPANATATPTASKIPIADGSGKLDGWITTVLDATSSVKGKLQLAGDLSGTSTSPTVVGIHSGSTALAISTITDGQVLKRDGTNIVSVAFYGIPTGTILDYGGTSTPSGFLNCDGSSVSRTTYANLFIAIGTSFGAGDGTTTFGLPDFRRKTSVGSGGTGTATLGNSVGSSGGTETHQLSVAEMPSHNHGGNTSANNVAYAETVGVTTTDDIMATGYIDSSTALGSHSHTITSQGGDTAHNNVQPSLVVYKIIKT